jgi:phage terminase large subunit
LAKIRLPNNWKPRDYQMPAWEYLERGGKHAELVWHRRSGKDELGLHRSAVASFERVAGYWYMLPKYNQARKAIWDAVNPHTGKKRIDEAFPHEIRKAVNNQEMKITLLNDSVFQVVGSDNPDSLVGSPPAGIVYSEWALSNPDVRAYLRPIIMENGGWQIFNTTPRGRNHALRTLEAAKKDPKAFAQVLDAYQTGIFNKQQLAAELKNYIDDFGEDYGKSKFEQEYLCSFDAANIGAILARAVVEAERSNRVGPHIDFDPHGAPIEISSDIGRRDTSTWWFWQPRFGGFHIVDYDGGFGLDAEQWCERLAARLSKYTLANGKPALGKIWLPPDARAKTFAAKHSAVEIFIDFFGAKNVDITPDSKKQDRVNAARTVIRNVAFSDKTEKGLDGLRSWSYKWDDERKMFSSEPEHDWASHDGDGFSYGCVIMREREQKPIEIPPKFEILGHNSGKVLIEPLDQLWKTVPKQRNRV